MNHLEISTTLAECGYRQITLRSFNELIAGVRYVSLETLGADSFRAIQFLPTGHISWSVTRWEADTALLIFQGMSRSEIVNHCEFKASYDWYAKHSTHINLISDYMVGRDNYRASRGAFFGTFEWFISNVNGGNGVLAHMSTESAFERAHPERPEARMAVDLDRQIRELEAREAVIRQQEAFAQVHEIHGMAAQADNNWDTRYSMDLRLVAEEVRRRVQQSLDNRSPIERVDVNSMLMEIRSRSNYRTYQTATYAPTTNTFSRPSILPLAPAVPATPKVEVVAVEPRRIILDDED